MLLIQNAINENAVRLTPKALMYFSKFFALRKQCINFLQELVEQFDDKLITQAIPSNKHFPYTYKFSIRSSEWSSQSCGFNFTEITPSWEMPVLDDYRLDTLRENDLYVFGEDLGSRSEPYMGRTEQSELLEVPKVCVDTVFKRIEKEIKLKLACRDEILFLQVSFCDVFIRDLILQKFVCSFKDDIHFEFKSSKSKTPNELVALFTSEHTELSSNETIFQL